MAINFFGCVTFDPYSIVVFLAASGGERMLVVHDPHRTESQINMETGNTARDAQKQMRQVYHLVYLIVEPITLS